MRHRLTFKPGTPEERSFFLKPGPNTVGRTSENDIGLSDASLSRLHARLDVSDDDGAGAEVVLSDLGSKNGTFVDGARIDRQTLALAHTLTFGHLTCRYTSESVASIPSLPIPAATRSMEDGLTHVNLGEILSGVSAKAVSGAFRAVQHSDVVIERADRDSDKLRILLKVSQLLASPPSLDALLTSVLDLVFEILDVDRGAILMVHPQTGELEPRVARAKKGDLNFSRSIARYVMDHNVAALFSDAKTDARLAHAHSIALQSIRTSMCAPLRPKEEVLGVLYVDNLSLANRFAEEDLEFLCAFANQAAVAVESSLLQEKLTREAVTRSHLLRFFPPAAISAIVDQGAGAAGLLPVEREATVLFCDISGYTAMSSRMRPTAIIELLNAYFPVMSEIVFRREGTLEKYIGDALLALWGVPFAHGDDAERAVLAAIDMQRAIDELNRSWQGRREIGIHIGVNTGLVAAGNIGSDTYVQYAAIGDATNVASRICNVAERGQIVIDALTASRLGEGVKRSALGAITLRGKSAPQELYRVEWAS